MACASAAYWSHTNLNKQKAKGTAFRFFESVKILLWSILTETSPLTRWTCSLLSSISILLMIPCGGLVLLIGYILFKKNKL